MSYGGNQHSQDLAPHSGLYFINAYGLWNQQ
ncbi:uncharacterized protein METZ01_LOCUS359245 [marine metagenome]|uniref:Uncharacterized protein n=1 Tax=marine metagenome TaxID=408172 RepID=A0A382SBV5_9ZZZZ